MDLIAMEIYDLLY
ncbi:hypothetical protein D5F84_02060 [Streptococcus agalactiae]|nr:hypothetical protein D5F84_02060 [Streptococcus agalactiae]